MFQALVRMAGQIVNRPIGAHLRYEAMKGAYYERYESKQKATRAEWQECRGLRGNGKMPEQEAPAGVDAAGDFPGRAYGFGSGTNQ
jgi:hypothetical protein